MADTPEQTKLKLQKELNQLQQAHAAADPEDLGSFQRLIDPLGALAADLHDGYQASVVGPIRAVIEQLDKGVPLAKQDVALIESFVVGDAEAYTRLENDFQSWLAELGRLVKVLGDMSDKLTGQMLLDGLGEVEDAQRVLSDVCNYLVQKERVVRFRQTMAAGLTPERTQVLIEILKEHILSPGL